MHLYTLLNEKISKKPLGSAIEPKGFAYYETVSNALPLGLEPRTL